MSRTAGGKELPPAATLSGDLLFVRRFLCKLKRTCTQESMQCLYDSGFSGSDDAWECLEWTGRIQTNERGGCGYGQVKVRGVGCMKTHRVAWMLAHGEWPSHELYLRHRCCNRACCNPKHLLPGTAAENNADIRQRFGWRWRNQFGWG